MGATGPAPGRHRPLAFRLVLLAGGMFAFGFALVPLYDLMCQVTGLGGKTSGTAAVVEEAVADPNRTVTVEFVAMVNEQAPWEFRPAVTSLEVHPGQLYNTTFFARNLTSRQLVGQAVPSVAPGEAARHFQKTECFCFTSQQFAPGEGRDMGLQFMVDPKLPAHVDRLTLSYTFFMNRQVASGQ